MWKIPEKSSKFLGKNTMLHLFVDYALIDNKNGKKSISWTLSLRDASGIAICFGYLDEGNCVIEDAKNKPLLQIIPKSSYGSSAYFSTVGTIKTPAPELQELVTVEQLGQADDDQ